MADPHDDLIWKLGARLPGHDYRIFTTGFVEATHPRTGALKRFSLIDCADWVNVLALTDEGHREDGPIAQFLHAPRVGELLRADLGKVLDGDGSAGAPRPAGGR